MSESTHYDPTTQETKRFEHPGPPIGEFKFKGDVDAEDVLEPIESIRTVDPDDATLKRDALPLLDLPSFGEAKEKCGNPIPATSFICLECGAVHNKPHVCNRYDCPMHWAHAVRRRAGGSADGSGVAPQLESLRKRLHAARDDDFVPGPHADDPTFPTSFHHLVIDVPDDLRMWSYDTLKRGVRAVRGIMDALGIQGLVAYHPYRGDHEDWEANDIGEWKGRINPQTEWQDVKDELKFSPHFHIVGVAPYLELRITPEIQESTSWVIHRITEDDSNVSIRNVEGMCKRVTYTLSHAGIYEVGDQRRLAAWMKGPDVNDTIVFDSVKQEVKAVVNDVSYETLGIDPPDMTCSNDRPPQEESDGERVQEPGEFRLDYDTGLPVFERYSETREHPAAGISAPISAASGPSLAKGNNPRDVYLAGGPSSGHVEGVGGLGGPRDDLPDDEDPDFGFGSGASNESPWAGDGAATSRPSSTTSSDRNESSDGHGSAGADAEDSFRDGARDQPDHPGEDLEPGQATVYDYSDEDEPEECGGKLVHISHGFDLVATTEWREYIDDEETIENIEVVYRSYQEYMEAQGLDPDPEGGETRMKIAEDDGARHDLDDREFSDDIPPPLQK